MSAAVDQAITDAMLKFADRRVNPDVKPPVTLGDLCFEAIDLTVRSNSDVPINADRNLPDFAFGLAEGNHEPIPDGITDDTLRDWIRSGQQDIDLLTTQINAKQEVLDKLIPTQSHYVAELNRRAAL